MKKIFDGKKYDTETAERVFFSSHICNACNELPEREQRNEFYKKKNGEIFSVHYQKIVETEEIHKDSVDWCFDTDVKYMAECCMDGDEYEAIFGPVEE